MKAWQLFQNSIKNFNVKKVPEVMDLGILLIQLWNNYYCNYNWTITAKFLPKFSQKIVVDSRIVTPLYIKDGLCNDMQQDARCFIVWMW